MTFDRTTFAAGAVTGAAVVSVAWLIVSWTQKAAEPPGRHSEAYDRCLAIGRSTTACDALMRVLASEFEKSKNDHMKTCLADEDSKYPNNPFNKITCEAEVGSR